MKLFAIITLLCLVSLASFCQQENVIKFKSEVTLTLTKADNGAYSYKITETNDFDKILENSTNIFKEKVDDNQIKLFFGPGKFGSNVATLLVVKSGLNAMLKYAAKIKRVEGGGFSATSVEPLLPNVKSIEEWPYPIAEIVLSDFSIFKN